MSGAPLTGLVDTAVTWEPVQVKVSARPLRGCAALWILPPDQVYVTTFDEASVIFASRPPVLKS